MRELREYFLPYQVRWIRTPHPVVLAEKSRRIGWTYASAFRAVERRVTLGTDLFYSSADLSAAREFVEACQRWARVFDVVATDLGIQVIDERDGLTAFVLRFENGAKVVAGSSNPKFFRSKGGDADADEFAFHAQPRELYKAMQPTALIWGHQMRVWSTHNGEGSFFNKLVMEGRKAEGEAAGSEFRVRSSAADGGDERAEARALGNQQSDFGEVGATALAQVNRATVGIATDADAGVALCLPTGPDAPVTGQRLRVQRVTLLDAVAQGLVERIRNLTAPDMAARAAFLEEIRASCPDDDVWNEEYLCQPGCGQSSLLSYDPIAACEAANLQLRDVRQASGGGGGGSGSVMEWSDGGVATEGDHSAAAPPLHHATASFFAGFDVGRKHDRSVLWVLERVGDVYWTRVVRVLEGVTYTAQEELLDLLMRGRAVRRLCVDSTGIGAMLAERLRQRWGHRVEPVYFTQVVKSELAMPLLRLFQDRLVRIPADAAVREDLHKVRKIVTASHNVRLDAPRDESGHADRFWALALAFHAADADGSRLPAPVMRKPVGW